MQAAWTRFNWPPYDAFAGPADLYHFPNFLIPPLRRGRAVVTIHDMSFQRLPQFAEARNVRHLQARIGDTARRADHILTDSAFSAAEIRELLRVPPERVTAIPLGLAPEFQAPTSEVREATLAALNLRQPYLLTVGTIEPRKNLPLLVETFERLTDFDGELVIAGRPGWQVAPILERIRRSPRAARIRLLHTLEDAQLPALYAGADLFLIASFYEGFGFPPLEAMACGTPVVSSQGGSLPEVLGDAARIVPGFEAADWSVAVGGLLGDAAARARLATAGRAQAARYTWAATARQTLAVYAAVGGRA